MEIAENSQMAIKDFGDDYRVVDLRIHLFGLFDCCHRHARGDDIFK